MPDVEIKAQNYRAERPPEHFAPFQARARAGEPEAPVYEIVRIVTVLHALITFRTRAIGSENVPRGPVISAPNHASFRDHSFTGAFISAARILQRESGAPVVPVAILGSHQVRNWRRLQFPTVTVSYGTPLRFEAIESSTREQQQEAADIILERIRVQHDELDRLGHRGFRRAARRHAVA